jgi:hypothetical protein
MRENIYKRWFPGCKFEVIALASDDKAEWVYRWSFLAGLPPNVSLSLLGSWKRS